MNRGTRIAIGIVYALLFLGAGFMTMVLWGLSALDTGPHATPITVAFAALTLTSLFASVKSFISERVSRLILLLPIICIAVIFAIRFSSIS